MTRLSTRLDKIHSTAAAAAVAALLVLLATAMPARAAEPVYPTGSRVGLVPPAAMVPSKTFPGFEDRGDDAAILITALPAAAFAELEKTAVADLLKKEGTIVEKREPMQLDVGKGFLIVGKLAASDKAHYRKWLLIAAAGDLTVIVSVQAPEQDTTYTNQVVRAALATLSIRATVPDAEQLSLLPFSVGDLAGFRIADVLPGRALLLIDSIDAADNSNKDGPNAAPAQILNARLLIAAVPGGPAELDDHAHFARLAFDDIGGIKDVRITMSEPLRIGGQQGFQTMGQAKDARTGTDVMVVQWLRFGGGGFLQMIGISRAEAWTGVLSRLRAVRESIQPK